MTITIPSLPALTSVCNIYLWYGQSNSTGTSSQRLFSVSDPTFGAIKTFGIDGRQSRDGTTLTWADLTHPPSILNFTILPDTEINEPFRARGREVSFCKALERVNAAQIAATGQRHRAVVATFGHTGYTRAQLAKGTNAYTNLLGGLTEIMVDLTVAGLTGIVRGVVYVQGEADFAASGSGWAAAIQTLQSDLNTDIKIVTSQSQNIPLFITQQNNFCSITSSPYAGTIPYPLLDQLAAHDGTNVILTGPMIGETINSNNLHYYGHQSWVNGATIGNALASVVVGGNTWNPVRPKTISRNSNIIDIEFWAPSGSIILDTTYATNTADGFFGFDFRQTGGSTTLQSITQLNNTTLRFTLSGTPNGTSPRIRGGRNPNAGAAIAGLRTGARVCLRDTTSSDPAQCNWCVAFDEAI